MLILETQSNGRTKVVLRKDWHPGLIGRGHVPKPKNYVDSDEMSFVQSGLLKRSKSK